MQAFTLIIPILLATLGLFFILYFTKIIFRNFAINPAHWLEKRNLKRKVQLLYRADLYLKNDNYQSALPLLREAFCLDHFRSDFAILEKLGNHHLSVLSRALSIAERHQSRLNSLAVLEDLLATRVQLQKIFLEKSMVKRGLMGKAAARTGATWASAEYDNQLAELKDRINTNRKSLESQLAKLFHELSLVKVSQEITYH